MSRLLNKDGVIKYSTHAEEIGNKIDKNAELTSIFRCACSSRLERDGIAFPPKGANIILS
jgi:hypothetical protein